MPREFSGASAATVAYAQTGRADLASQNRADEKDVPVAAPEWAKRFIFEVRRRRAAGESCAGLRAHQFGGPEFRAAGQLVTRTTRHDFVPGYVQRYVRELMIRTLGKVVHGEPVSPAARRAVDRFVAFEMAKEPVRSRAERDANLNRWADAGRALMAPGNPTERHRRRMALALS